MALYYYGMIAFPHIQHRMPFPLLLVALLFLALPLRAQEKENTVLLTAHLVDGEDDKARANRNASSGDDDLESRLRTIFGDRAPGAVVADTCCLREPLRDAEADATVVCCGLGLLSSRSFFLVHDVFPFCAPAKACFSQYTASPVFLQRPARLAKGREKAYNRSQTKSTE